MSQTTKNPFTMVGAEDAAVCVDGVCEIPSAQSEILGPDPAHDQAPDPASATGNTQA